MPDVPMMTSTKLGKDYGKIDSLFHGFGCISECSMSKTGEVLVTRQCTITLESHALSIKHVFVDKTRKMDNEINTSLYVLYSFIPQIFFT